jgi:membrane protein
MVKDPPQQVRPVRGRSLSSGAKARPEPVLEAMSVWCLCKRAALAWNTNAIPRYSAALAFYTFFSMAPLLTIAIAFCGLFFGRDAVVNRIYSQIEAFAGPPTAEAIRTLVRGAWKPGWDFRAMSLGILTLLIGASGVLNELQDGLHAVWSVPGARGIKSRILGQAKLLGFLLGVGMLFIVSVIFDTGFAAVVQTWMAGPPWAGDMMRGLALALEWGMCLLTFAAIFKWLPDAKIAWSDVWSGSAFTAVLFMGGKFLLSLYLGRSGFSTIYGAAGALVITLTWVYYSALIFYFGAEFTKAYAETCGSHAKAARSS